ncbi:restriction endonuclease subunit S [Dietzia sp. Alg238-R159]|uniref:restriction endonuclease subunit S n=1 Tax=Dietzia sp. Alg238-R159 TaxID=2305986 RepID=UPI0013D7E92F|nr:restriction endonuclease subunit S [Dietzia sp. Alg238-R159]
MKTALKELVTLRRGNSYQGALVGEVGAPLLGLGTIAREGGFKGDKLRHYPEEFADRIAVSAGDVYVSLKDMTQEAALLGAAARVPDGLDRARLTQDTIAVDILEDAPISRSFLYWTLRSPQCRAHCKSLGTGTTNLDLGRDDFLSYEFWLPSTKEQKLIAEVLGALDDKIVANRRVVDAGDALICALYSLTPKASAGRTFADVADIGGGGTPSTKSPAYWDGDVAWATPTDVTAVDGPWLARTTRSISEEGLKSCSSPLYPEGSILMTSRATIGAVVVARKPMAVNQGFIVLNAVESEMQWWLESQVRARTAEFETWANGATFLEISRGTFKRLPVLECSPEDLERFNRTAQAVRERQSSCQAENDRLARTRDELLPLLMNGRITVKDAEGAVGDVV